MIPTQKKIASFSTHLRKRIQKGPVRGIFLKLQERRIYFVPEVSAVKSDQIEVDKETLDMVSALGMSDIPGLVPLHAAWFSALIVKGSKIALKQPMLSRAPEFTSVITTIGEEHMAALGGSLESIALAKSGIIKHGCPVRWFCLLRF